MNSAFLHLVVLSVISDATVVLCSTVGGYVYLEV